MGRVSQTATLRARRRVFLITTSTPRSGALCFVLQLAIERPLKHHPNTIRHQESREPRTAVFAFSRQPPSPHHFTTEHNSTEPFAVLDNLQARLYQASSQGASVPDPPCHRGNIADGGKQYSAYDRGR
jgi:hypothetical protein